MNTPSYYSDFYINKSSTLLIFNFGNSSSRKSECGTYVFYAVVKSQSIFVTQFYVIHEHKTITLVNKKKKIIFSI